MKEISTVVGVIILLVNSGTTPVENKLQDAACPTISVGCARKSCDGSPFHFVAQIRDVPPAQNLSYQWSVSSGEIVSGQGTGSIRVVAAPDWRDLTASLKAIGLPTQCANTASISVMRGHVPTAQLFEQFGAARLAKVRPRLDAFADQLSNKPGTMGYILFNGGRGLAERAKSYLVVERGIEAERIVNVRMKRGGRLIIKLYVVPSGAAGPAE